MHEIRLSCQSVADAGQSKCRVERNQALEQARRPQESMFIPECNEDGTFAQVCIIHIQRFPFPNLIIKEGISVRLSFACLENCSSDRLHTWLVYCFGLSRVQCRILCNLA